MDALSVGCNVMAECFGDDSGYLIAGGVVSSCDEYDAAGQVVYDVVVYVNASDVKLVVGWGVEVERSVLGSDECVADDEFELVWGVSHPCGD